MKARVAGRTDALGGHYCLGSILGFGTSHRHAFVKLQLCDAVRSSDFRHDELAIHQFKTLTNDYKTQPNTPST